MAQGGVGREGQGGGRGGKRGAGRRGGKGGAGRSGGKGGGEEEWDATSTGPRELVQP